MNARADAPPGPGAAIACILASVFAMAFADAVVKRLSGEFTVWQIFVVRSLAALMILGAWMRWRGVSVVPRGVRWTSTRSALLALTWLTYYASLPLLDLSVASVIVYLSPMLIVVFAGVALGETVTRVHWTGVLLGFAGVVVITRPGTDGFTWATVLPLASAVLYALAMLATRARCRDEPVLVLSFGLNVALLVLGLAASAVLALADLPASFREAYPFLTGYWQPMGAGQVAVLAGLGVLIALYGAGVARAYQIGPASLVATFDYGYLVSAAVWGSLLFDETPDGATVAGMVLITLAGALVSRPAS